MLYLDVFETSDAVNDFFELHHGKLYLIKFIVSYNPFSRAREYHIIWSSNVVLRHDQHMAIGIKQKEV